MDLLPDSQWKQPMACRQCRHLTSFSFKRETRPRVERSVPENGNVELWWTVQNEEEYRSQTGAVHRYLLELSPTESQFTSGSRFADTKFRDAETMIQVANDRNLWKKTYENLRDTEKLVEKLGGSYEHDMTGSHSTLYPGRLVFICLPRVSAWN